MHRRAIFTGSLIAAGILFVAAVLPLPFFLIAPGSAVDLSTAVRVGTSSTPRDRFFLTDVHLVRASPLWLAFALFPGVALARADTVLPSGWSSGGFDDVMQRAMRQSQATAAVVAERAAGFAVPLPAVAVEVEQFDAASQAAGALAAGDIICQVNERRIVAVADVGRAVSTLPAGSLARVILVRAGRRRTVAVRTVQLAGRTRLGIFLGEHLAAPRLPVPVHFSLADIGGSSGGLMMALRIYDSLRSEAHSGARSFAGTGTLALDGRVGAIEGTPQKLIAAKRAGARVFFVPRANFGAIAGERDVRVIPVDTFNQAVREL